MKKVTFLLIITSVLISSCRHEKNPNNYNEPLLPGTGTAEYGVEIDKGRWLFLTTEGFSKKTVVLGQCPDRLTSGDISFKDPQAVSVKEYGYSVSNIFSDYYYDWACYYFGDCGIYLFNSGHGYSFGFAGNEKEVEGVGEKENENVETDVDIFALKDNYLFSLNRYSGVIISDISDPSNPYIEKIIPLNGYPAEMFLYGRYMVVGYAGYSPDSYYYYSNQVTPTSYVDVWDVKKPEDASLLYSEEVKGELVQLLKGENEFVSLSIGSGEVFVTSFRFKGEKGEIEKVSEEKVKVSSPHYLYFYLYRASRIILDEGYLVVAVPEEKLVGWHFQINSTVHIYRVKEGELIKVGSAEISGILDDERRMDIKDGVLRVISGDRGSAYATTISLKDGSVLDEVTISTGERLYATAFQGDVGYAVTFRRIDPLFTVDFSDPQHIRLLGKLEVVGWAEQLYPFENKLLSLGPEGSSVALSLYDTSDITNVKMLSRLLFGEISASEVYNDYRSFLFLPEQNLIAFPYTEMRWFNSWWWGWSWSFPLTNYVQFVELRDNSLVEGGKIKHHGVVRRIIPEERDHFIALSNEALQIIDLSNTNSPSSISELRLLREVYDALASDHYALLLLKYESGALHLQNGSEWRGYYKYELVDIREKLLKPIALIISPYRIEWMKEFNGRLILMLSSYDETLFYSLKINEGGKIEGESCVDIAGGIRATGKNVVTSDSLYVSLVSYGGWGYYGEYSFGTTRYLLKLDPLTFNIHGAFKIGTNTYFRNSNYSSSETYYSDLAGASPDGTTLYYFTFDGTYIYSSEYKSEFTFYALKVNVSGDNFSVEKINLPGEPVYFAGVDALILKNQDRFSAYDISVSPPVEKDSIPRSSSNFNFLLKTKNYFLYIELRNRYPEPTALLKSYVFNGETFTLSLTREIGLRNYYPVFPLYEMWFYPVWYYVTPNLMENSDWVFSGIKGVLKDPIALRNNRYCLEQNCLGVIYEGEVLHAGSLDTFDFKTTSWYTGIAEGGGKLLIPRGKMGLEVVDGSW